MKIDMNCDMGESYGRWSLGEDEKLLEIVSSANVACGYHAGDPLVMDQTVRLAVQNGVKVGAHPGHLDLQGFGRREINISPEEAETFMLYQIGALAGFCRSYGQELVHVKPHGALYNQAAKDMRLAEALARGVKRFSSGLVLVGLAGSKLIEAGELMGLRVANEGFPDRAYEPDGSLRSRKLTGAVLESESAICEQAVRLAIHGIEVNTSGDRKTIFVDTLCIHGDHPGAAQRAAAVRLELARNGIEIGVD